MKRCKMFGFGVIVIFLMATLLIGTAMGAEYTVAPGDNLTKISKLTGQSIGELVQMNNLEDPNFILIGQKIIFLSQKDIEDARLWCEKRTKELSWIYHLDYYFFMNAIKDLDHNHIRYSINEDHGLHFSLVLTFAKAWRAIHSETA